MKEYRFHKEYDYTDHCRSKLMEKYKDVEELSGMAEFDKRMMDNMLEKLDKLEFSTTYDDVKLEKINTMTEPLRKFADFMGGLLICSADQEGLYSCTLRLEPPADRDGDASLRTDIRGAHNRISNRGYHVCRNGGRLDQPPIHAVAVSSAAFEGRGLKRAGK